MDMLTKKATLAGIVDRRRFLTLATMAAGILSSAGGHAADPFPSKPISLIVPFGPGSAADVSMRRLGPVLSDIFGRPVVIENVSGAGGMIGTAKVAQAVPDGHTVLLGSITTHVSHIGLGVQLSYDPQKDFSPLSRVMVFPNILVVSNKLGVSTVAELIDVAKKLDRPLTFPSGGIGTAAHLNGELFAMATGLKMDHVPYKMASNFLVDLISGTVDIAILNAPSVLPAIQGGRMKALAVVENTRFSLLPDLPTVGELQVPGTKLQDMQHMATWIGLFAPKGTPTLIVEKWNAAIRKALSSSEIRNALTESGAQIEVDESGADFARFIDDEIARWVPMIRTSLGAAKN